MGFLQLPGLGQVHFHEFGTGSKPMLAFHGYGLTGRHFNVLQKSILSKYHVYSFDFFFHGETRLEGWNEERIFAGMPRDLVKGFLLEWIKMYGRQKVTLMAYSIGADIALSLVEDFPDLIEQIILIAPDGIVPYKGFEFIQRQAVGKQLFRLAMKSNWLAPSVLKGLKKAGLINKDLFQIAYSEIDTPKKRADVYYTLNFIKQLKPDIPKLISTIDQNKIKCLFVYGKYDQLFPRRAAEPILRQLPRAEVLEVPMGHWLITPALDDYLVNCNL